MKPNPNGQKKMKLTFNKEKINNYNENYEETLNNVYTLAALSAQIYARLGYQIKLQEAILVELRRRP